MMPASSRGRRGSGGSVSRAIMVALFALFALLVSTANALSATGSRVLVVVSSMSDLKQYSTMTKDLQQRGFQLSYRKVDDAKPALVSYEERQFDHIVFLADDAQSECSSGPSWKQCAYGALTVERSSVTMTRTSFRSGFAVPRQL